MAEEKKPKIDLKARLGKAAAAPTPTPGPAAGIPVPQAVPAPTNSAAPPGMGAPGLVAPAAGGSQPRPGGVPVPPGVPVGPPPGFGKVPAPALDPSNPLAAAVQPYRPKPSAPPAPAPPPQAQRIEVDEMAVQEARKGARKQGVVMGLVAAVVLGVIGYIAGGAVETNKGRSKSVGDAKSLAEDVGKARDQLKTLADKVEAGRNSLQKDKKFPNELAKDLGGINVDFDGGKLAGVRFSGFSQETTSGLIEFITSVQQVNDRKTALASLLSKLQKPLTDQLSGNSKASINFIVLVGPKDPSKNTFAMLAPLVKPIDASNPANIALPAEFTATDPTTRGNVTAPKYVKGDLDKPVGIYVLPKSVDAAFPSETAGAIGQLVSQFAKIISDIRGEQAAPGGDVVTESKAGLVERADNLVAKLNKVQ